MQLVKYTLTWFHVVGSGASVPLYEAGKLYPVTDETRRHVGQGIAELVEAPDDLTKAESAAKRAEALAAKAAAAAEEARALADAAAAAQVIADQEAADAVAAAKLIAAQDAQAAASVDGGTDAPQRDLLADGDATGPTPPAADSAAPTA